MYFFMHVMNDMLKMLNKSHKTIYECILLFLKKKKKNQICFNDDKKIDFDL